MNVDQERDDSNSNNNHKDAATTKSTLAPDLHEAILANSFPIVEMLLARNADPNQSPILAPIGIVATSPQEKARDLHRTLGRVFRSRPNGTITPLTVAVCNAYHNSSSSSSRASALQIVVALLQAGANVAAASSGIAFCKIGSYPHVTMNSERTAASVALFLKRFPSLQHPEDCHSMMDQVASLIFDRDDTTRLSNNKINDAPTLRTWTALLEDDANCSDLVFVCPDGRVKAHLCVLKTAVPDFLDASMIHNSSSEYRTSYSTKIIKTILKFIYIGQFDEQQWKLSETTTDNDEIIPLFAATSEFQLERLMQHMERCFIGGGLKSPESCKVGLLLSHRFSSSLSKLKTACWEYIQEDSVSLLLDPSFVKLSKEQPEVWSELTQFLSQREAINRGEEEEESIIIPAEALLEVEDVGIVEDDDDL